MGFKKQVGALYWHLRKAEAEFLQGVLDANNGNVTLAAAAAGIPRQSMHRLMRRLQLVARRLPKPEIFEPRFTCGVCGRQFESQGGASAHFSVTGHPVRGRAGRSLT